MSNFNYLLQKKKGKKKTLSPLEFLCFHLPKNVKTATQMGKNTRFFGSNMLAGSFLRLVSFPFSFMPISEDGHFQ